MEFTHGLMGRSTQVSGNRIKCMVKVSLFGPTEGNTKENFRKTNAMGRGHLPGAMVGPTKEGGPEENNLALVFIQTLRE